ncbi:RHS repeat-associated core domain-containing protein [Geodermatophilus marinus]|uniref:RHS repeat-associated core domain-containing protein n=1 Tax=Geodermatophilus sp. LHW52908 TaxID=2303986 RepID=UPI000E3CE6E1|nr:RHS repeat-associated core domain-containing protein [Geodermatophilus sp. LHW52908]RFU19084.1 hypothetical protein D0Z06_23405 [Geodermatophilus sp. LHW52908]
MLAWSSTVAGAVVVALVLREVFQTLFVPTRRGRATRAVFTLLWRASRLPGRGRPSGLAGPLAMVAVITLWGLGVVLGGALVYWPHLPDGFSYDPTLGPGGRAGLVDAVYVSLVTTATLGFGDVVPTAGWLRVVVPLQAIVGFALLTGAVSWVMQMYPALNRRRVFSVRLPRAVARAAVVGGLATAVVAGSVTGVLAAPAYAPTAGVAVKELLAPVLVGVANAPGTGAESIHFSARTIGAGSWDLLDDVPVSGRSATLALPADRLAIGERFEYQVSHCDDTGCTASAVQTSAASAALGAGERPGATRLPFTLGDRLAAQVDVGSGNLLVTATAITLPRRASDDLEVGLAYNSVTRRADSTFAGAVGAPSSGWRLSTGPDVRLRHDGGTGLVVYTGPNGLTGTFTPVTGTPGSYTAPAGFKMDLTGNATSGWELFHHDTGQTWSFDPAGRLTAMADRSGNQATFGYDSNGAPTTITSDVGPTGARTLDVDTEGTGTGRITEITQTVTDAGGYPTAENRSVTLAYDGNGYLASMTDQEGRVTTFTHGSGGNLNAVTAPGGAMTTFGYDNDGRVETVTQPTATTGVNAVTRFLYEPDATSVADPNSNQSVAPDATAHTRYELTDDGMQLVDTAIDPAGKERSQTYTPQLDVATATDTAGTTTLDYGANGGTSLTGITAPTGAGSSFAYGNTAAATRHQPTSGTDAQGNTSTFTYNGAGQQLSAADAGSNTASVAYNADGTVDTSTSPSGAVTDYTSNSDGQLTGITPPSGTSLGGRSMTWDGYGRLATFTDGRGITTSYSYDDLDRITEVDFSDSTPDVSYAYDTAGRLDSRDDGSGTTSYDYDPLGRLTARSHSANAGGVSYSYDKVGNLATAVNAAGTTSYTYDVRNLVTAMTPPDGRKIEFAYDDDGRRTDTWFHTNTGRTRWAAHSHTDYDASGRIDRTWTSRSNPWSGTSNDTTRVFDRSYSYAEDTDGGLCATATGGYPDSGLRWVEKDELTGVYTNYCYDSANRLIMADPGNVGPTHYAYDANGNRTSTHYLSHLRQAQTVNAADQLTMSGYAYDAAGNLTADPTRGSFTYNAAGQMVTNTTSSGTASYLYAGTDQTELITDGSSRTYTYGRSDSNGLPIIESYVTGSTTYSYLHDPQGTPLAIVGANAHYLALDGLGSIVATINHDGAQTAAYSYDPWGKVTASAVNGSGIVNLQIYGYTGGVTDTRTGYVHLGHRWYDPTTGRFTQQDPLETLADPRRANRYEYAASDGAQVNLPRAAH